jgi:asparagine synthetase B (glutamine-hydrolysing)
MCGITGILDLGETPDRSLLERMCRIMTHRGPDGEGYYMDGPAGLGHRRLSIIDLESGKQPMSNEDDSIWITYNGEIYNFPELRKDLINKGHKFKTRSDTETIIHSYEEYGFQCLKRLRGMFAFALWDNRKKLLFIARDRIGKKPLYYCFKGSKFMFASELKAILQDKSVQKNINPEALVDYLTYHYIPFPKTIFEGIYKLPPAHYMTVRIVRDVRNVQDVKDTEGMEDEAVRNVQDETVRNVRDVQIVRDVQDDKNNEKIKDIRNNAVRNVQSVRDVRIDRDDKNNEKLKDIQESETADQFEQAKRSNSPEGRTSTAIERLELSIHQYWDIEYEPDYSLTENDWAEALREKLKEAVRMRLISDVPLGAFLSGGIDSSTVVALMSMVQSEPVKTFSIGFKEQDFSELRKIADKFHTDHHEMIVDPDAIEVLPKLAWEFDEPFADSSAIPTFYVSKMAREQVTVILSGDGGDETFAGYQRYLWANDLHRYDWLPHFIKKTFFGIPSSVLPEGVRGKGMLRHLSKDPFERYAGLNTFREPSTGKYFLK